LRKILGKHYFLEKISFLFLKKSQYGRKNFNILFQKKQLITEPKSIKQDLLKQKKPYTNDITHLHKAFY